MPAALQIARENFGGRPSAKFLKPARMGARPRKKRGRRRRGGNANMASSAAPYSGAG
eukprot:CAMPEP_0194765328 /NCGR_PEP_ID=MMETSP0323_2-20130528/26037_1 /TAXON_ID=2866 ORGANISM="Crypthecodinium cohnii, Strain Seligo" /NCGR_SAMPLE_ID=MMETSP0323_2 /ASSEMBLY_ACC=CAM_ASM_000346 /LENGTH=56 /DNA_ID=CAMNT_0039694543 /DNA_START=111 /DNA_END=281 /DNA_ORIENTATION=+